ncbi:ABC transporter substrate-binding protein [Neorhizobium sp. Rsf11]|uniref:ABC transporter substrate-binding protein n=1 Tax=Neorhizobium phenanthreniclasticum TaxID=3157917 RepID=A0ABV0LWD3_9HYPH
MFNLVRRAMRMAKPAALSGILCLGAISAAHADIQITDVLGRRVMLEKPAQHVMLGFYFEDYIAITGPTAIDRLKAISLNYWKGYRPLQYEAYLKTTPKIAELIDVGDADAGTMSAEKIIASRPDVVILSAGQYKYLGAAARTIEQVGIPLVVVDYNAQTVEKHVASTLIIGKVMGAEERAEELAEQYKAKVADTLARVERASKNAKPKVYVELGQKGAAEFGNSYGQGMWAGVVDAAGGRNIAAGQIASWGPLNPEYVLSSKPDAIFITGSEWTSLSNAVLMGFNIPPDVTRTRAEPYIGRAGWLDLPAVKNGEVYAIYHGGTRTLYDYAFLRYMAKALYPEAFRDVDPAAELSAYYRAYLPVKPDGTFMLKLGQNK